MKLVNSVVCGNVFALPHVFDWAVLSDVSVAWIVWIEQADGCALQVLSVAISVSSTVSGIFMLPSEQWSAEMCGACRTEVIHFVLCGFLFCEVILFYQLYCSGAEGGSQVLKYLLMFPD